MTVFRIPRIEQLSLDACLAMRHKENPKEHDLPSLIESIERFGFVAFPSIDEDTKVMIAGHGRCEALAKMREDGHPAPTNIEVDGADWRVPIIRGLRFKNEKERDAYIIADNKQNERGGWNVDNLTSFLTRISDTDQGFRGLGFDGEELGMMGFDPASVSGGGLLDDGADRFDDGAGFPEERDESKESNQNDPPTKLVHRVRPPVEMTHDDWSIHLGDCLEGLRQLADNSVDLIVTDPPAGISFMGRKWDDDKGGRDKWIAWLQAIMSECLRVLKPGGHMLGWALPRTSHWTAFAIENAGFDIRDRVSHLFGSGFPKSLDVNKAVGEKLGTDAQLTSNAAGVGTALKPAMEDWWLAQKPREKDVTIAETFMKWGTGGIDIDGCRIGDEERFSNPSGGSADDDATYALGMRGQGEGRTVVGRWPAHIVFSHTPICEDGQCADGCPVAELERQRPGASLFFYVAKPCKAETEAGLDDLPDVNPGELTGGRAEGSDGLRSPRAGAGRTGKRKNIHPTKKSIELMRYLVRLIAPPPRDGVRPLCLDPFAGSGTTGLAALVEGVRFVGFELDKKHHEIACARMRTMIDDPRGIEVDETDDESNDDPESSSDE